MTKVELSEELIIAEATKLGIINQTKVRNLKIRRKHNELRSAGTKYDECVRRLSSEFYVSESSIVKILAVTK